MDRPCKVANPARGQLRSENGLFSIRLWSRETDSVVPPGVSLCLFSTLRLNLVLTHGILLPLSAAAFIYLYRQPPWDHSRVYQVTQLRTDGVYCRKSAGTTPVPQANSNIGCCLFRYHHGSIFVRPSFPTPTDNIGAATDMCDTQSIVGGWLVVRCSTALYGKQDCKTPPDARCNTVA